MTNEIKLSKEETQQLFENDSSETLMLADAGDWEQDGKYQYACFVYKHKELDKFYRLHLSRQGSYHTDWIYSYEYSDAVLEEVQEVEVVRKVWQKV